MLQDELQMETKIKKINEECAWDWILVMGVKVKNLTE